MEGITTDNTTNTQCTRLVVGHSKRVIVRYTLNKTYLIYLYLKKGFNHG